MKLFALATNVKVKKGKGRNEKNVNRIIFQKSCICGRSLLLSKMSLIKYKPIDCSFGLAISWLKEF